MQLRILNVIKKPLSNCWDSNVFPLDFDLQQQFLCVGH